MYAGAAVPDDRNTGKVFITREALHIWLCVSRRARANLHFIPDKVTGHVYTGNMPTLRNVFGSAKWR
jgi:hypothetical protein